MKYTAILFIVLCPLFAVSQQSGSSNINIDSLAASTVNDLIDSWSLGIDSNSESVDIRVYNKFKNLFDSSAVIEDDITVFFEVEGYGKKGVYKTDPLLKPFDIYAHDVTLKVKGLNIDNVKRISSNTANMSAITCTLSRRVDVQMERQYVLGDTTNFINRLISSRPKIEFENQHAAAEMRAGIVQKLNTSMDAVYKFVSSAELLVTMYCDRTGSCKITSIKNVSPGFAVFCPYDYDGDGVLNQEDSLPNKVGDFTANGMPDYDFDGITDTAIKSENELAAIIIDKCKYTYGLALNQGCPASYFSSKVQGEIVAGFQSNLASINLPQLNQLGYQDAAGNDAIDVLQSSKGALQNPKGVTGIGVGGSIVFYFGKKRKSGISIGGIFSRYTANYELTEPMIYTYKATDGVDFYRRQLTIRSLKERITYYMLNFPVLYNYRFHLGRKNILAGCFKAGPSLMLFKNTSEYDAVINVGGIYQIDPMQGKIVYNDYLDPQSIYNVYVTSKGINTQNTNPGAASVFSQLSKNYDFTDDKNYRGRSKNLSRIAIAFNSSIEVSRKITESFAFKGGLYFIYASLPVKTKKYRPLDNTTDDFNSIFNSTAKSKYMAYGVSAGLTYIFW